MLLQRQRSFEMFLQDFDRSLELRIFFIRQMQLDDVFYAILADLDRYRSEAVFDAVRAIEVYRDRQHLVFIVVDRADQFCRCGRDTEFRAALGRIST